MSDQSWLDELGAWLGAGGHRMFTSELCSAFIVSDPDKCWLVELHVGFESRFARGQTQEAAFRAALELIEKKEGGDA